MRRLQAPVWAGRGGVAPYPADLGRRSRCGGRACWGLAKVAVWGEPASAGSSFGPLRRLSFERLEKSGTRATSCSTARPALRSKSALYGGAAADAKRGRLASARG